MEQRVFGPTGVTVPVIGQGTWRMEGDERSRAIQALRAGVYDYLTKPLESLDVFEMSLSRALELQRLLRENARLFAEVQRLAVTDPLTACPGRPPERTR